MSEVLQEYAQKAGSELLDFTIDYTEDLAETSPEDDIAASSWTKVGSIVITDGSIFSDKTTTVWVSGGGRVGEVHRLINTVTTVGGRTFVRVLMVRMVNKLASRDAEPLVTLETPTIP